MGIIPVSTMVNDCLIDRKVIVLQRKQEFAKTTA